MSRERQAVTVVEPLIRNVSRRRGVELGCRAVAKVALEEMRCRLRRCWYQTTAVERGKEIWRNNGLEGATGSNKSDAIEPSQKGFRWMDEFGDNDEMRQHDRRRSGRRESGGRKSIVVVVDC